MERFRHVVAATLLLAAAGTCFGFDLFSGSGVADSNLDVEGPQGRCTIGAETRFKLAPSPESSASAPKYLLTPQRPVTVAAGKACTPNVVHTVPASDVDSRTKYYEWTIGAAVIPFKYYRSGDKGVASNSAAIGYLGYKWHRPGGDIVLGLGAGPSTISVAAPSGAQDQEPTQATGFSYGLMLLGQLGYNSTAQFGVAVGRDRVSKSLNWVNDGKTWIGVQIGAKIY